MNKLGVGHYVNKNCDICYKCNSLPTFRIKSGTFSVQCIKGCNNNNSEFHNRLFQAVVEWNQIQRK